MGSLSYVSKPSSWLLVVTSMDLFNLALLAAIAFCEVYSNFDNICYSFFKDNVVAHLTSSIIAVCIFSFSYSDILSWKHFNSCINVSLCFFFFLRASLFCENFCWFLSCTCCVYRLSHYFPANSRVCHGRSDFPIKS